MSTPTREVHLVRRPQGWPVPEDFAVVETELPDPGADQVLVRNTWMSVDPYMRGRMNDVRSYVPPFALGAAMDGGAVGEVVASGDEAVPVGATVVHQAGWREHALLGARHLRVVDAEAVPPQAWLGVLGMPGLTAYVGLTRVAEVRPGDTVFVSGAAGAVGSVAGQVARELGAGRVVGSAGSPEKCAWLTEELGFDAAFDYHDGPVARQLRDAAPDGVDVYFDNVGGDHLEAAILRMNDFGRIAACGAIASYNEEQPPPGPRNLMMLVSKRLRVQGFIVTDHGDLAPEYTARAATWVADGRLRTRETVHEGLDEAVTAFLDLMRGGNLGKMLVRLG
ncbi:NADP-dependent oxidoreductase [Nocardioides perillae]|uniref:Enoyl reductase (ER) domain-containing protein n=1 Tax=Nocardioides perillae TaxID=1119534 RepID=A0A7Y9UL05_9ACTN|nr:NADP-dependent oxidoreductase [Nocardioides perillae]NYG55918.1 hypothetical protein [Nocardioides perillae]